MNSLDHFGDISHVDEIAELILVDYLDQFDLDNFAGCSTLLIFICTFDAEVLCHSLSLNVLFFSFLRRRSLGVGTLARFNLKLSQ